MTAADYPLTTAVEVALELNQYEATHTAADNNIWQDVILRLDIYDGYRTDVIDTGANDRFALINGTVIWYDQQTKRWHA